MDFNKKYEYVMERLEIREFCRFAYWEQFKYRKSRWAVVLLIIVAEAFLFPEAAIVVGGLVAVLLLGAGVYYYKSTIKQLEGQPWTVFFIEGNRLRVIRGNSAEVPFRNIELIHRSRHLLMLGYLQGPGRPAWFVMPLRVFENEREQEAFLAMIRNPQTQARAGFAGPMAQTQAGAGFADSMKQGMDEAAGRPQEYMRFSFSLDAKRWVRLQTAAADLINGGTFGRPTRTYRIWIWGLVMMAALTLSTSVSAGKVHWLLVCYSFAWALWFVLLLYGRNPEKRIRKQAETPEVLLKVCGPWQVSLTEEGVTVGMPMDMKSYFSWDTLMWLVETQEAFYLFYKDKKHFIMIAKESFVSWDQVDDFHRICADHGIQKMPPKKARYVPGWLPWAVFALMILVCAGVLAARIYLDVT